MYLISNTGWTYLPVEIKKKRCYYVNTHLRYIQNGGFQMKDISKKVMVFSMVGLMQFGLFSNVTSASPEVDELSFWEQCTQVLKSNCNQIFSQGANNSQIIYKQYQKTCNK